MTNKEQKLEMHAGGLFGIRRDQNGAAQAIVFAVDARGRSDHKKHAAHVAAHAAQRKDELAENRTVIPLLIVLRKLTSRGHLDIEVDPHTVFGNLERLRHLRAEAELFNSHTSEEFDADPLLAFRVRSLIDVVNGFGFRLPYGGKLEFEAIDDIIAFIETEYVDNVGHARDSLREDNAVKYMSLQEVFHIGDTVFGEIGSLGGTRIAYRVGDVYYEPQKSMFGNVKWNFHLSLEFIASIGDDFAVISFDETLDDWTDVRAVSTLAYAPARDESELEPYRRRGGIAAELAQGHHYRVYRAGCFYPQRAPRGTANVGGGSGPTASMLATPGKIVVDAGRGLALGYTPAPGYDAASLAFHQTAKLLGVVRRANDSESDERRRERMREAGIRLVERMSPQLSHLCWPAVIGFSLNAKSWGHVLVDGLSPVERGEDAWNALVLPPAKKELLLALAAQKLMPDARQHHVDAIAEKGSGSLFLLHGPPGVGKTLTAEALAGHYGRPLYCLTFGELGSTAHELEARMNEVLQLCSAWRCVCLLDEGDALVERREKGALLLNSLVGVLLKCLDSFEGLLFLTTNRVATFDPAALSRVTLAIRYNHLSLDARKAIWRSVLKRAGGDPDTFVIDLLAERPYSGRDINNAVRLALALAEHRQSELTQDILDEALAIADDFRAEIADPIPF